MSETYDNIPSDRWAEYMQNAHEAVGEAADQFFANDPKIKEYGEAIVEDAGVILDVDSRSGEIPEGAQKFVDTVHDMGLTAENATGAEQNDGFPQVTTAMGYIEATPSRAALKHFDPSKFTEQTGQQHSTEVDETVQIEAQAPDRQSPEIPPATSE